MFYGIIRTRNDGRKEICVYFCLIGSSNESRITSIPCSDDGSPSGLFTIKNMYLSQKDFCQKWAVKTMRNLIMSSKVNPFVRNCYTLTTGKGENDHHDKRTVLSGTKKLSVQESLELLSDYHDARTR